MNNEVDYDRDNDREDFLDNSSLKQFLVESLTHEKELMKKYLITAERIHNNDELKNRLQNLSEGNAKRSKQLEDDLNGLQRVEIDNLKL